MYKKITRVISLCLVITMLCGTIALAVEGYGSDPSGPFEQMKDEYIDNPYYRYAESEETSLDTDLSTDSFLYEEGMLLEEDPDAGKTDRYIVKYKSSSSESAFLSKTSSLVKSAEEFTAEVSAFDGKLSVYSAPEVFDFATASEYEKAVSSIEEKTILEVPEVSAVIESDMQVIVLSEKMLPSEFADELKSLGADDDIEYIQPDFILTLDTVELELIEGAKKIEDNEKFEEDNNLETETPPEDGGEEIDELEEPVDEPEESEEASEPQTVIVAVIDTAIDVSHEIFEGYLHEDAMGLETDNLAYAHGTHVAGTIVNAAKAAGADVKILPINVFENGNAYTSDIIAAIEYATAMGADIINCSFGSSAYNQALYDAMEASDALFVCAVGNARRDFDETPAYPAGFDLDNVISVASTNADGGFSYFSNYGAQSIDIAAEGREVYSAMPGNEYGTMTGTSMSAAFVSGVASAVLAGGDMEANELKSLLTYTADTLANLENKVIEGKRVNFTNALSGTEGSVLNLSPADDFDVHGYQRTDEENWELFSSLEIVEVAAGGNHSLALASDGTVWAWGDNSGGQLGNGTTGYSAVPVQVVGLSNVSTIVAGGAHSIAQKNDGTVWAWGNNASGQLGVGTTWNQNTPVQVTGLTNATAISGGKGHTLALLNDNTVMAWGEHSSGQLGTRKISNYSTPQTVITFKNFFVWPTLTDIVSISAGSNYSIALAGNGDVYLWGSARNLGVRFVVDSSATSCDIALKISLTGLSKVAPGNYHFLATSNGMLGAWGNNEYGQLGSYYAGMQNRAVIDVSAGDNYSVIVDTNGEVFACGWNYNGRVGSGDFSVSQYNYYVRVGELTGITQVSAGGSHTLAIDSDGKVWAWGSNVYGQLGNGTRINSASPTQCILNREISYIEFEESNYAAEIVPIGYDTFQVNCIGYDANGDAFEPGFTQVLYELDGEYEGVSIDAVTGVLTITALAHSGVVVINAVSGELSTSVTLILTDTGETIVEVSAGAEHILALTSAGRVLSWGSNGQGQLGNGSNISSKTIVEVLNLTGVVSISAGRYHSLALTSNGQVWAWGANFFGQLGNGTYNDAYTPVCVLSDVSKIVAGEYHSLAVKKDSRVCAWGNGSYGQLGYYTTGSALRPSYFATITTTIIFEEGIVDVAAGNQHSLMLKEDGTVWACGGNSYGQIGTMGTSDVFYLSHLVSLSNIVDIAAGGSHNVVQGADGTIYVWGNNNYGQLGIQGSTKILWPSSMPNFSNVKMVDCGENSTAVVKNDGSLWVLGYMSGANYGTGTMIEGLSDIFTVACGQDYLLATKSNGSIYSLNANNPWLSGTPDALASGPVQISKQTLPTEIAFDEATYSVTIHPVNNTSIQVSACAYDEFGDEMVLPIQYSLMSEYQGITIDGTTGVITVGPNALTGTANIVATCGNIVATAELVLNTYELHFESSVYTQCIPSEGPVDVTVEANFFDGSATEIDAASILYSIEGTHTGVIINSETGVVTISNNATAGSVSICASYGSVSTTATLILRKYSLIFDLDVYSVTIPNDENTTLLVNAVLFDENFDEFSSAEITYTIDENYPGVSIDSITGIVSVSTGADIGTVVITATSGVVSQSVDLLLKLPGDSVKGVNLDVEEDGIITLALKGIEISSFEDVVYTISYDTDMLELVDAAVQAYGLNINPGRIYGTGITIVNVSNGVIEFTVDKTIPEGKLWSGVVTILKFKAIGDGTTTVSATY